MQTQQQCLMEYRLNLLNFLPMLLTNIKNHGILKSYFSDGTTNALVRPTYKKKNRQNKENCRSVSILNGFSIVYERFINDIMLHVIQTFPSNFISAYREYYSANHVLTSLTENWKINVDNNKLVGAVFIDCIPHDSPSQTDLMT